MDTVAAWKLNAYKSNFADTETFNVYGMDCSFVFRINS